MILFEYSLSRSLVLARYMSESLPCPLWVCNPNLVSELSFALTCTMSSSSKMTGSEERTGRESESSTAWKKRDTSRTRTS